MADNNVNFDTQINALLNAAYGEDVRDALVVIARALQAACNNQLIEFSQVVPVDSADRRGHINSGDLDTYYGDDYLGLWTVNTIRDDQPDQVAHVPDGASGYGWLAVLRLIHTEGYARYLQAYIETAANPARVSWRMRNTSGWQDWRRFASTAEVAAEAQTRAAAVAAEAQTRAAAVAAEAQTRAAAVAAVNDGLDYYRDHSAELVYHADSISGTQNKQVALALPAGTYRITADRYTSTDADRDISRIIFNQEEGDNVNVNLDRDVPIDEIVVLPAASARFTAYASVTNSLSAGDSFTITNFSIGRVVTNPVTESIEGIVDTGEYVKYSGTIIGTNSVQTALNLTPGAYRITADSFVSSDTDETTSLILFNQAEGDAKAVYMERGVPIDEIVVLPAASARFTAYASRKADVSAGDTFTVRHLRISKILDDLLPEKVDELAGKFDYLVDTGGGVKYSGTISGKYYVQTALPLPAGTYRITADSLVSSDTDEERSLILFNQDSEDVANKAVYVKRDVPIDEIVELKASSLRFTIYASTKAAKSTGDTFTVTNLKIAKQIAVNNEAGKGAGGYHDLPKNPYPIAWHKVWTKGGEDRTIFTEAVSTTHAHGTHYISTTRLPNMAREYDHVAISNYYPSVPWYPLEAHYETVPEGFLASPNSEQVHFTNTHASVHICAVGSWLSRASDVNGETIEECIEDIVNNLQFPQAGGVTINHPKWSAAQNDKITEEQFVNFIIDLLDNTRGIFGMEIYNAGCEWNNNHQALGYAVDMWDEVLATGRQIFGLAVPDHWLEMNPNDTNGFGYNHVIVRSKTEQEILLAYAFGRFYASIKNTDLKFLNLCYTDANGFEVETTKSCTITFITSNGEVYEVVGTSAAYVPTGDDVYVRVEATDGDNTLYSNAVIL